MDSITTGWPCVCILWRGGVSCLGMAFLCGSILVEVSLPQAGIAMIWPQMLNNDAKPQQTNKSMTDLTFHHYSTRISTKLHVSKVKHSFAKRYIRYSLPNLINQSPTCITDKLLTHSLQGLSHYAKHHALTKYSSECNVLNCYICR